MWKKWKSCRIHLGINKIPLKQNCYVSVATSKWLSKAPCAFKSVGQHTKLPWLGVASTWPFLSVSGKMTLWFRKPTPGPGCESVWRCQWALSSSSDPYLSWACGSCFLLKPKELWGPLPSYSFCRDLLIIVTKVFIAACGRLESLTRKGCLCQPKWRGKLRQAWITGNWVYSRIVEE